MLLLLDIENLYWIWINISLWTISLMFYLICWLKNPGYSKKNDIEGGLLELLNVNNPASICPDCAILKPSRSKHCDSCKRCIEVFDHHCPWINNCVGVKNHRYFLCFLIFLWSFILSVLLTGFLHLPDYDVQWAYWEGLFRISEETTFIIKIVGVLSVSFIALIFEFPLT